MAVELWTSPVTGHRRRGTRASEITTIFESSVTVRSIYESLRACPADASGAAMGALMDERGFDVAGVKEMETDAITRFVSAISLRNGGAVADHAKQIRVDDLVADATPLTKIVGLLGSRPFFFVLVGGKIAGIVMRADLNKPPARIYLFSLISLLEMHLMFWIRKEYGDTWCDVLTKSRLDAAKELLEARRQQHQELDLCECLQICDKATLVVSRKTLCERFEVQSKTLGRRIFKRVENLRNSLSHSQSNLTEGENWELLSETVAWIDRTLHRSDAEIEKLAAENSRDYVDKFWSASQE